MTLRGSGAPTGKAGPDRPAGRGGRGSGRAVVAGATGFTGGLVARRLSDAGLPLVLTGRSEDRLRALAELHPGAEVRRADVARPGDLADVLRAGDVLVNCAGPFTEIGEPAVRAAVEAGAHYLDTTGEQAFMLRVLERWEEPARRAGVAVVNAMAFEYALGDCALAVAAQGLSGAPASADVVYSWRGAAGATSAGTRRSALRAVAEPGVILEDGSWRRQAAGRRRRTVRPPGGPELAAVSLPAGEILTAPRHLGVDDARGWMIVGSVTGRLLPLLAPVLPPVVRAALPLLDRLAARGPAGPDAESRRESRFQVLARVEDGTGEVSTVAVEGRDPYGVTAEVILLGARAILGPGGAGGGDGGPSAGVLPPALLVEPRTFLRRLGAAGVRWRRVPDPFPGPGGDRARREDSGRRG